MIPITLSLKGIYSYQENEQTINFNHLTDAGIFGIFGSVGSGKSTILEAISFALYGETERLNRRENRAYNMMNLKSDNLLIDFVFKGGENNSEYRFMVKGRRNKKNFTDVKTFNREAFKKHNNSWLAISTDSIEDIIGLNYLNFRRAVIIPQGKFQEFLQLGDADRTKMMKELFHLERFDLSYKVRAKELENDEKISFLDGELNQLLDLTPEKLIEINEQIQKNEKIINQNKIELIRKQKQYENLNIIQELFARIDDVNKKYTDIRKDSQKYKHLDNELKEYRDCVFYFKSLIESKNRTNIQNIELQKELQTFNLKFEELKEQINKDEKIIKKLKTKFDNREQLKTQSIELEKLLKINEIETACNKLSERIKNGEKILNDTTLKIEKLLIGKIEFQGERKKIKSELPDLAILSKIKNWYTNNSHLKKELLSVKNEIQENEKAIEEYTNKLNELSNKNLPQFEDLNVVLIIKTIEIKNRELEQKISKIDDELKHFQIRESLTEYAQNLHDGDACPVCGSNSHPYKLAEKDISGKIKDLNSQKGVIKNKIQSLTEFEKKVSEYHFKINSQNELLVKQKQSLIEINKSFEAHEVQYPKKVKIEETQIDNLFDKAKKLQQKLHRIEDELSDIEKLHEKELLHKDKYSNALNKFKSDFISANTQITTLRTQISHIDIKKWQNADNTIILNEIKSLLKQYNQIISDFENRNISLNNSRMEFGKYEGIIQIKEADFKLKKQEFENIAVKLVNLIEKSDFRDENQIEDILKKDLNIDKIAKEIEEFNQKLFSLKEQLSSLQVQAKGKEYNKETHKEIINKLSELKMLAEVQGKELGSLEKEKETLEKKLLEKQKLKTEQKKLKLRAENIANLKSLFKSNGFVNYVSSVYLQNLINSANERFFRLTNQKLQLELTEDNNFVIRDFLNQGKTRNVKTLSGGQTFQASLSLALALADNIQSLSNSKHNFFFLDEGFGSLDTESLSIVFSSLKSLRKENRIVGIISHVEDLQQEVETYLKIENNPESGSQITKSWN